MNDTHQFLSLLGHEVAIMARGSTNTVSLPYQHRTEDPEDYVEETADYIDWLGTKHDSVYVSLNPLHDTDRPAWGLKDSMIIRRKWMLVDLDGTLDPTERDQVLVYMREQGWDTPIETMSGGGFGLLYPVDLPPEDNRISIFLRALKNIYPSVDQAVGNAGRWTRAIGTFNTKRNKWSKLWTN